MNELSKTMKMVPVNQIINEIVHRDSKSTKGKLNTNLLKRRPETKELNERKGMCNLRPHVEELKDFRKVIFDEGVYSMVPI